MSPAFLPRPAERLSRILARPPRGAWAATAAAWAATIFLLSSRPGDPAAAKSFPIQFLHNGAHAPIYALLSGFVLLALAPRPGSVPEPGGRALGLALLVAVLYALSDEWHQYFVPGRTASAVDVATDAFGATCGLAIVAWAVGRGGLRALLLATAAAAAGAASALLAALG